MRGGPGLGNIAPEQSDYNQVVKGGGHGGYKVIVLAPGSVQEMCDLTMLAFDLADEYRMPVYVLTDGMIGQMMEKLELPEPRPRRAPQSWALNRVNETKNCVSSIYMEPKDLEELIREGKVTVNGVPASLGDSADPEQDAIVVDGKPLPAPREYVYILLNKPRGYVTTLSDEKGRPNAAQLVADCGMRVYPVGRCPFDESAYSAVDF